MAGDDTNDIAGEAEDTRERISATIDELQDRLNPRRIVEGAVDSVHERGSELLNSGLGLARAHPVTLGAVGLAIGLALLGANRVRGARVDLGGDYESYSDYDDDYQPARKQASPGGERFALMRASGAVPTADPLVGVIVGLAAGALVGALFPETEQERRLLGDSSKRFVAAARDRVEELTNQAKDSVQSVVDAAKSELGGNH